MTDEQEQIDGFNSWAEKALFIAFNDGLDKGLSVEKAIDYAITVVTSIFEEAVEARKKMDEVKERLSAPVNKEV